MNGQSILGTNPKNISQMKKIKLYIAASLDGYIAREDGSLDWLYELPNPDQEDYGYGDFLTTVDTIVMGRKTYEEILGFGVDWPYSDFRTLIITSQENYRVRTASTEAMSHIDQQGIDKLRAGSQKNIWLVGGGQIITEFLNLGAVDEMTISMVPRILGKGIELFPNGPRETLFDLVSAVSFESGMVNLMYSRK